MDRNVNNSLFSSRSPFSPRSRQNVSSKRSMGQSSFRKSSGLSISSRSTQLVQLVLKTQSNCVERFGQPLPVLITEALTFADRNVVVSAKISPVCGYAWLVCGRRLLIWQYRQTQQQIQAGTPRRNTITNQCYELQLPQSDLAHRAELISVFINNGASIPSCIAVSPEGVVRYWPIIAHEGVSVEQLIDLQGQECDSLTFVEELGCILATTTCTVVLVQPHLSAGRNFLTSRTLRMPSGWLGGLSKRMSSLIFGPISSEQSAETRLVRVLTVPTIENNWLIYVLAGHSLQKWQIASNESEQLLYVSDLTRLVREGFNGTVWESCSGDHTDTDTWILDLQLDNDDIMLLAAAVNMHLSPQIHYAMITLDTSGSVAPSQFSSFSVLKMSGLYREDNPSESLGYRFILSLNTVYVYNHRCITVIKPNEEPDCLEFNSPHDFLLGGSVVVNTPVFFSRNHGLISIASNELSADFSMSMIGQTTMGDMSFNDAGMENLTLCNFNPEEIYAAYKDTVGQLTAAFIYHVQNNSKCCKEILSKLFLNEFNLPGVDTVLDKTVISVSKDLLNDKPANDPRWSGETQVGLGSSYTMQVLQQLEDKLKVHTLYIKFLKETQLWDKLSAISIRNMTLATPYVLAENSEKIIASIALKSMPYDLIMERAIEKASRNMNVNLENGLTHQDIFYREVTKVHHAFKELVNNCDEAVHSDMNPAEVANLINETNVILLKVLRDVFQYRHQYSENLAPNSVALLYALDYLPWTSASGNEGLMDALLTQQNLTYTYAIKTTSNYTFRTTLIEQLVSLIDFILDGRKNHLESIKEASQEQILMKQYQNDRRKLIEPLIQEKEWEAAAILAEKYLDFQSLIIICEKTQNQSRLDEYMERFSNEDFSQFLYSWYMQENKQGKLLHLYIHLIQCKKNVQQLNKFLSQHPSLSWIQKSLEGNYEESSDILINLAIEEKESVRREKSMLSMAKLAKLASGIDANDNSIVNINKNLDLITYQEELPDYVLQQYGYDTLRPPPIHPKELIHLYICPEYVDATELDFKKALDLLIFIQDIELKEELQIKIWKSAILRDAWDERNLDSPLEILQKKLMFKIADLALALGEDPATLLPPLDVLMEENDLSTLMQNKTFQFLIKTGYEHISSIMNM